MNIIQIYNGNTAVYVIFCWWKNDIGLKDNTIIEQKCNQLARQLEFPGRVFVEPI